MGGIVISCDSEVKNVNNETVHGRGWRIRGKEKCGDRKRGKIKGERGKYLRSLMDSM